MFSMNSFNCLSKKGIASLRKKYRLEHNKAYFLNLMELPLAHHY